MKVGVDFTQMKDSEILSLARKCVRELNEIGLQQYKIIKN